VTLLNVGRISLREIRLPLKHPFRISSGEVTSRRILLVEQETSDGARAWSECVAFDLPNYSPETIDTAWWAIRAILAPRLLNTTLPGPGAVTPLLDEDVRGHRMAKAALEMGVWALAAEREGAALAQRLGGTRHSIPVGVSLGIQATPAALVEQAVAVAAEGYRKIKIKIAPGADVEFVAAVREALPDASLMVDANNAYTLADADRLAELDAFDLVMIEQPLDCEDLVRHADLQRRLRTPLCLDESITSPDRAEDMLRLGSGRIINIKPGRVGGFAASLAIHDMCLEANVPVWCGGMLETGVGRAYNVALASLRGFTIPGDVSPSARYWEQDIVLPEWTMTDDGMMDVPLHRPGIGVLVDEDRIDDLTTRREDLTAR
jgi:o-succinylbenzoate synthase